MRTDQPEMVKHLTGPVPWWALEEAQRELCRKAPQHFTPQAGEPGLLPIKLTVKLGSTISRQGAGVSTPFRASGASGALVAN